MIERRCNFLVVTSGEAIGQIEPHLIPKDTDRAGSGAILFLDSALYDVIEHI